MDASSEMIYSVLPLFMVTVLGASMVTVGVIEGVAEATAAIIKVFSGTLSDYLGKRKVLLVAGYWLIVAVGAAFALARFSEAFLVMRAESVGLALGYVPVIMVAMNALYAGASYPAGIGADQFRPAAILLLGLALLVAADLVLALARSAPAVLAGAVLWDLHMAFTQGLLSKIVADSVPVTLRGTGFGIFNLVSGISVLLASVIAGALWNTLGPIATFLAGAGFAAIAAVGVVVLGKTAFRPAAA